MNNFSTSGYSSEPAPVGFATLALLPTKASMRLSLISVWLSTLEPPST